jgi:hypothetical protein
MNGIGQFMAAQIAAALGKPPQAIRRALRDVKPASVRIVKGKEITTWTLAALPAPLRCNLDAEARQRRYRDLETMLANPPAQWEPPVPLNQIADSEIARAGKLREALMPSLERLYGCDHEPDKFEQLGLNDYAKVFGHRITPQHWHALFKRTQDRDAGAENYACLEIYLPDNPALKKLPEMPLPETLREEFSGLSALIDTFPNPVAPTDAERRAVWTLAFRRYDEFVRCGITPKAAARRVRQFLFAGAPFLAASRDALLKTFHRKLESLKDTNGELTVLGDGRANNGDRADYSTRTGQFPALPRTLHEFARIRRAARRERHCRSGSRGHPGRSPKAPVDLVVASQVS